MFRGITVSIINLVLIIPITLALASHNSGAISQDVRTIAKPSDSLNVSTVPSRLTIINFDDGYKSQFINAKPILDMYGFKATFLSSVTLWENQQRR